MKSNKLTPVCFRVAAAFAAAPEDDGSRRFEGTAYSGGVVTDHPFFEAVAFDLSTTTLKTPAPALFDHGEPIGVIDTATLDEGIGISGRLFSDLDGSARKVTQLADHGLPWQLSVGIWPGQIEQVKAGAKVKLNGREMSGPLTVFRQNRVREVSFVALGADDKTSAAVFSLSEGGVRPFNSKDDPTMTTETIDRAEHDRIVAELQAQLTAAQAQITETGAALETLRASVAEKEKTERTASVKSLFKALNREAKDEDIAPYLAMSAEGFEAVKRDLMATKPQHDPALMRELATGGKVVDLASTDSIVAAARALIHERAQQDGTQMSISEAVVAVRRRAENAAA